MADDGLTLEAWSMPHVGALTKKFNFTKYVVDATFNDRFNDLSDGTIVLADDFPLKDELFKIDEANHANDAGSMVRILRGATPIMHYLVTRSEDTWNDQDPVQKFTVEGLEWLLDRATVPHYDHPADPTVEPDWIYGADSVLGNTDFEVSGVTSETVQLVIVATAGTFKIGVDYPVGAGFVYTGNIVWNPGASDIATALEALADIDDAFVTGAGTEANPFIIEVLAPASVDMGWATDSGLLTGTASIITVTSGGTQSTDPWTRSLNPITGVFHGSYTTFEISTTQAHAGTYSLKVDGDPPAFPGAFPGAQQLLSVTPGRTFRASVWVYPTQTGPFRFVIRTRDETFIAQSEATLTANTWTQMTITSVVIPLWVNQIIFRVATTSNGDEPAWYVDDALFAPGQAAATYGAIMNDIRDAAVLQGVLSWLTPTWTDANDSDGVAWDRSLKWNVNHDQTFLQLLEYARRWNYESRIRWDAGDARFEWDLWNPSAGGQTRSNIAITGKSGVSGSGPIVKRPPDFTYMRVEGEQGRWGDYVSTTLDDVWGRLEKAQPDRQGVVSTELDQLAQRLVTRGQDKTASRSVQVEDPSILPWQAYEPGDVVYLNLGPKDTRKQLRIAAIAVSIGGNRATPLYEVHFVSPVLTNDAAMAQGLRFLLREFKRPQASTPHRETIVNPVLPDSPPVSVSGGMFFTLAAYDSSPRAQSRADIVCDGTSDDLDFDEALTRINATGGAIICASGHYIFHDTVTTPLMFGTVSIRGEPGAVFQNTSSIPTSSFGQKPLFNIRGLQGVVFSDMPFLEITGVAFDGFNVALSAALEISGLENKPSIWIHDNEFWRYAGRFISAERGTGEILSITDNHFRDSALTVGGIQANTGFVNYDILIQGNLFDTVTGAGIAIDGVAGNSIITGNVIINSLASFFLVDAAVAIFHNWVNGVYLPGDHAGADGVIANTLADTKGDLIAATGADTWAKLTVGANETQLIADSAQTTGLKWYPRYRTLNTNTTAVGNVGTGEDDLISFTVPAAALATNGDHLEFEAAGTFAATANNKRIKVKFGAATILDTGVLAITAAGDWQLRGKIIRTGAATQKCDVLFASTDAALRVLPDYATAAETLSGTVVLKLTGEATADNDVVAELMVTSLQPV